MQVLAFGTYDARVHPRVAVLCEGLAASGADLVELNEPLPLTTAERVKTLQQPWRRLPALGWQLARAWASLVRGSRSLEHRPDVVLVGFLGQFDVVLARLLFRRSTVVLDLLVGAEETALDRGTTGPLVLRLLRGLDRLAIRCADVVVIDTEEHRTLVPTSRQQDVVVVAVGAPAPWFAAAEEVEETPRPPLRVVFYGLFTPLQGAPVIGAAAALLADDPVEITMIGSGQDLDETVAAAGPRARVTWVPWVEPSALPGVVATHDVCLGVFGRGPKAESVVPNKVFQGLAAGLAVVTSDTPPQRRELADAVELVPADDPVALAAAIRALAADPDRLVALRARGLAHARRHMAPRAVTGGLVERLSVVLPRSSIG